MILYKRRRDETQRLLDSSEHLKVMRIFLFGQRARRRSARVHDQVPSLGPSHRERAVAGRREI
jgi:hypothetical protein